MPFHVGIDPAFDKEGHRTIQAQRIEERRQFCEDFRNRVPVVGVSGKTSFSSRQPMSTRVAEVECDISLGLQEGQDAHRPPTSSS